MITARQVGRWALYAVGGVIAVVILLRVGIGIYLNTSAGKQMVARQIEQQIGMPVEVVNVRLGLVTSSIGMKVFDPAAPERSKAEVLAVDDATADVSLFSLATGHIAPTQVALRDVKLTLHVGKDGNVVTTLPKTPEGTGTPGKLPSITLSGGKLSISQEGRPEFTLEGLNLAVEPNGDSVKLTGTIDDPRWLKWNISGNVATSASTGSIELATTDAPLTMERLSSVPFVPAEVWDHVRPDGRGAATIRLWSDSTPDVHYAVEITPNAASLTLPDASVTLTQVTGHISVSGAKVTLVDTRAALAGGSIAVSGDFDFAPEPTVVRLNVSAEKLDTTLLPKEWELTKDFQGKLQGKANLTLRIYDDGRIEPEGNGEGKITDVKFRDLPFEDIPIRLHKAGSRYRFEQHKSPKVGTQTIQPIYLLIAASVPAQEKKEQEPPPKKKDEPTVLDATIRLRDIELAELLDKLKVKLDYKISGKVTAEATVAVPVTGVTSQASYRFAGKISSPALSLEGLTIRDVAATMTYQNGTFTLTDLSGKIDQPGKTELSPGVFHGTITAVTDPPGDVTAVLTIDRIPVGEVLKALPGFKLDARGIVNGKVSMKAPYEKLSEPTTWSGSGDLTSSELVVEGRSAKDIRLVAAVEKGVVALKDTSLSLEGIPVRAEGTLALSDKYAFSATVKTTGTDITDLRKLVPEIEIPAPVEGVLETETRVKGTASPFTFTATGEIKASKLTLAKSTANSIDLKWELTREKLVISELKADAFSGTVTGSANVPFAADKAGAFEVNFKNLDASAATELVPDFPVKIAGKVSGKVGGEIPPAKEGQARVGNLDLSLTAPKLTVQGIPAERLAGKVTIRKQTIDYELEGKTLGGTFEVKGRYPGQKKDDVPPGERGSFRLTGVDLSRIAPEAGYSSLSPLRGRLDANFDFDNDFSTGSGRIRLSNLQWGNSQVSQQVVADLVLRDGMLQLANVSGRVAGGEVRARMNLRLADTRRNFFTFSLNGAEAKTLLAPFTTETLVEGPLTVVVHGRFGSEMRGSGTIAMARGTVSGIQVSDLRIPFDSATTQNGYGHFIVREASVSTGSGRARAELTLDWGTTTQVKAQIRFTDVPLRTIAPELGENALLGSGRITGRFDLDGSQVRSVDDLKGTLIATLNNTSVKEVPLLRQVTPFLNTTGLVRPFQSGDIRANLNNGVFRVQRLALANPAAQLFAEGTISTGGRVDLNVVAHTGTIGPEVRALRLFGLRLPGVGPLPLTLIRDVSDFLSNRTVRLTITGSTSNPIVRVNVGALLSDQAVRFFLTRYVLPTEVAGAAGLGSSR